MKKMLFIGVIGFLIFSGLLIFANFFILKNSDHIYSAEAVPTTTLGLVFGGGMKPDGTESLMQADRVSEGVALYKEGKVSELMMTGDDGGLTADEIDAMKLAAIKAGVPKDKILLDRHGYRTYESCYRESRLFGVKKVIAVSQAFHLPRIIYLCQNFGIDTVGVAADFRDYAYDGYYMKVREWGARLKAWLQITITKPPPHSLSIN